MHKPESEDLAHHVSLDLALDLAHHLSLSQCNVITHSHPCTYTWGLTIKLPPNHLVTMAFRWSIPV